MADDTDPLSVSTADLDTTAQEILLASSRHDVATLRSLLRNAPSTGAEAANIVDGETGYTPLHAAVAGFSAGGDASKANGEARDAVDGSFNEIVVTDQRPQVARKGPGEEAKDDNELERAVQTVQLLFENGAIWNALDAQGETPGCLAWRLGAKRLYELVVDAGVRAELLFQRLDGYEVLGGGEDSEDEEDEEDGEVEKVEDGVDGETRETNGGLAMAVEGAAELAPADPTTGTGDGNDAIRTPTVQPPTRSSEPTNPQPQDPEAATPNNDADDSLKNETYLSSRLTFTRDRLLDDQNNAVMMDWERTIMARTVDAIMPPTVSASNSADPSTAIDADTSTPEPLTVLNIGHGMGIFDTLIQNYAQRNPSRPIHHHIIEAHPAVLSQLQSRTGFLATHKNANITLHPGTWQDILLSLPATLQFDAIFHDTFAEPYSSFRDFFSEYVITLLKPEGKWSFFMGLGADRRVCYDVYTRVVECDLFEAGFGVEWREVGVPALDGDGEDKGEDGKEGKEGVWKGVRRRYWALDEYRLPVCEFLG